MYKIPDENRQFSQTNESDRFGNIYSTKNIDFDEKGYLKLAKRTSVVADSDTLTDLQDENITLAGLLKFSDNIWILASKNIYKSDVPDEFPTFAKDALTDTPEGNAVINDLIVWDTNLYMANDTNVYTTDGSAAWTVFSTDNGEILTIFENLDKLAISIGNRIKLLDSSGVEHISLKIPSYYDVTSMTWNKDRLYVTTYNEDDEDTLIFEWDGLTSFWNTSYKVTGHTVFSSVAYKDGVAVVVNTGELIYCRGGLQTLGYLPIYFMDNEWARTNRHRVHKNGMVVRGEKIYFGLFGLLQNAVDENRPDFSPKLPGGVWCYDPSVGLYHKYSIGQSLVKKSDVILTTAVDISTDIITVAGFTVPETGTPCFYKNSTVSDLTNIVGLEFAKRYFVIKESDTTLKLATTLANANAGTAIDLTGTGNDTQYIIIQENQDFGDTYAKPGAIMKSVHNEYSGAFLVDDLLIGGIVAKGSSVGLSATTLSAVQGSQENRGYFITPKIESNELEDNYISLNIKWRKLVNADDKFVIKYRTEDKTIFDFVADEDTPITWVDGSSFTCTKDYSDVSVGDEVEITRGNGSGVLSHITVITESAGTYTVTLDEYTINITAGDKAFAMITNWTKLDVISQTDSENDRGYKHLQMTKKSKWIQFKIELRGVGTTLEELIISNKTHLPVL